MRPLTLMASLTRLLAAASPVAAQAGRRPGPALRVSYDATLRPHVLARFTSEGLLLRGRATFPSLGVDWRAERE